VTWRAAAQAGSREAVASTAKTRRGRDVVPVSAGGSALAKAAGSEAAAEVIAVVTLVRTRAKRPPPRAGSGGGAGGGASSRTRMKFGLSGMRITWGVAMKRGRHSAPSRKIMQSAASERRGGAPRRFGKEVPQDFETPSVCNPQHRSGDARRPARGINATGRKRQPASARDHNRYPISIRRGMASLAFLSVRVSTPSSSWAPICC
jgi:hypothetical protein